MDYMTFVLSVEEDGPAYMAGLRPGKSSTHASLFKPITSSNSTFQHSQQSVVFSLPRCALIPATPPSPVVNFLFIPNTAEISSPSPLRFLYFLHSVFCNSKNGNAEVEV